jgi:hypothetical protein
MNYFLCTLVIGVGATLFMDLWSFVRKRVLGVPLPNYGWVGRWLAHLVRGRFRHQSMAKASSVQGERLIGWVAHYLIGIGFAGGLLYVWGLAWVRDPTMCPALLVGLGSVAAPFLIMQPGMGAGVAASRTPRPNTARLQRLVTHGVFGIGLYAGGWLAHFLSVF